MNESSLNSQALNAPLTFDGTDIDRHVTRGLSRVIEQFKGKVNIEKLLKILLSEFDEIETAYQQLVVNRQIDTAFGKQLDMLGDILGRTRDGFNDNDYRARLKLQVGINTSEGEAEKIITVWKALTGSEVISLTESFPASILLTAQTSSVPSTIMAEMERVTPAGVGTNFAVSNGVPFGFFDSDGLGFGTTDDNSVGGTFISFL